MTEEEGALLAKFDRADAEIDRMLEGIIDQVDKLQLQAEGIG